MELRRLIAILRRRLALLVVLVVAGLLAAFLGSSRTSIYQARAVVYIGRPATDLNPTTEEAQAILTASFVALIPSPTLAQTAIADAHVDRTPAQAVSETAAVAAPGTSLINIVVRDPDPVVARNLANATAEAFIAVTRRVAPLVENPGAAIGGVQKAVSPGDTSTTTTARTTPSTISPGAVTSSPPASLAQAAAVPSSPVAKGIGRNVALGGLAGLLIGLIVVLLLDWFGLHSRSPKELEDQFGLPVLSVVPRRPDPQPDAGATAGAPSAERPPSREGDADA